jgi:hypothetical protein
MTKTQTAPEMVKRGAGKPVASRRILAPDDKGDDDDEIDRNRRQYENAHRRYRERESLAVSWFTFQSRCPTAVVRHGRLGGSGAVRVNCAGCARPLALPLWLSAGCCGFNPR